MKTQQAFIGLRSGGVLVITKGEGGEPLVDVSQVALSDVTAGLVGQNRFANQLHRQPYTVLEHSVIGSYLFDDPRLGLDYLYHDASEGFGICDLNWKVKTMYGGQIKRVEGAILAALAPKFGFRYPSDPILKVIDRALGAYELLALHPAADRVLAGYGLSRQDAESKLTVAHQHIINRWLARPPATLAQQEEMWLDRRHVLLTYARDRRAVEGLADRIRTENRIAYQGPFQVQHLARDLDVPAEMVRDELRRLVSEGAVTFEEGHYVAVPTAP